MQTISETIQEEILNKFHQEICAWSKHDILGEKVEIEERQSFVSINEYVNYNQKILVEDFKQTTAKKSVELLENRVKKLPKETYLLKKCDMINKFQIFEFLVESEGEGTEVNHQVQQNDFVMVSSCNPELKNDCYFNGIVHFLKEGLLIIKMVLTQNKDAEYFIEQGME